MSKLLDKWDAEFSPALFKKHKHLKSRREFLTRIMTLSAGVSLIPAAVLAKQNDRHAVPVEELQQQPWLTLSEVQGHLFPKTQGSPGAGDINAIAYLKVMLDAPDMDTEERNLILKGVDWLEGIAVELKQKPFAKLNTEDREQVLRRISKSRSGENWLSYLMTYIVEALLSDPVYGGNPDGIGWKWLQHQPGFPRPPQNKKYWLLGK